MLDVKRLRLLWALHARGTISAVAEALSYSPSAVSQQLRILEQEAGVPLLRRVGRTLELTPAGEALVAETEGILAGLERAEAALHRVREEVTGTVRVAGFQTALLAFVPDALRALEHDHPELRVEVVHYEPGAALVETWARGFDIVIAEQYPGRSRAHLRGMTRDVLARDPLWLALPPHAASARAEARGMGDLSAVRGIADLASAPWVMEPRDTVARLWAEQLCRAAGFDPDVRFESADLQAHVRLIDAGHAVGILPGLARVALGGEARVRELEGAPHRTVFTAARASREGHPALAAVRRALHAAAGRVAPEFGAAGSELAVRVEAGPHPFPGAEPAPG